MVIGNGLIAQRFASYRDNDRFLIFASGVSNSKTRDKESYQREIELLWDCIHQHKENILVYFSTCSIYDPDGQGSPYITHKLEIERIIRDNMERYFILRVSNVAGRTTNPNTVLNYLIHHIRNGINFDLWTTAYRNIIDIDDVFYIAEELFNNIPPPKQPVNIGSPFNYAVKDIVTAIETFLGKRSNYVEINKGSCFAIDLSVAEPIFRRKQQLSAPEYLDYLLSRYY